jgi:hypothetical protein
MFASAGDSLALVQPPFRPGGATLRVATHSGNVPMLDLSRDALDTALRLHGDLGQGAFSFVSARVEEARQASDPRGVRLWNDVASELLTLDRCAGGATGNSVWRLMQRIEYYRHRATEVERKAATAPEAHRPDMLELAMAWRDLALHADLQARLSGESASHGDG